jgi:hypothetical protein
MGLKTSFWVPPGQLSVKAGAFSGGPAKRLVCVIPAYPYSLLFCKSKVVGKLVLLWTMKEPRAEQKQFTPEHLQQFTLHSFITKEGPGCTIFRFCEHRSKPGTCPPTVVIKEGRPSLCSLNEKG